jgi:hypothetical protein
VIKAGETVIGNFSMWSRLIRLLMLLILLVLRMQLIKNYVDTDSALKVNKIGDSITGYLLLNVETIASRLLGCSNL